jgi:hypothetical protein
MNVTVPGKPHTREITLAALIAYLVATGWAEDLTRIVPHEPGPHPFYRGVDSVYFADCWSERFLSTAICRLAEHEGRAPSDVLDAIAALPQ